MRDEEKDDFLCLENLNLIQLQRTQNINNRYKQKITNLRDMEYIQGSYIYHKLFILQFNHYYIVKSIK